MEIIFLKNLVTENIQRGAKKVLKGHHGVRYCRLDSPTLAYTSHTHKMTQNVYIGQSLVSINI